MVRPHMKPGLNLTFWVGLFSLFSPVLHFPDCYFLIGNGEIRRPRSGVGNKPEINVGMMRKVCFCPFLRVYGI